MKNTDKLAQGISRRDFIKGAAAGAVGLAAAGMLGAVLRTTMRKPRRLHQRLSTTTS